MAEGINGRMKRIRKNMLQERNGKCYSFRYERAKRNTNITSSIQESIFIC